MQLDHIQHRVTGGVLKLRIAWVYEQANIARASGRLAREVIGGLRCDITGGGRIKDKADKIRAIIGAGLQERRAFNAQIFAFTLMLKKDFRQHSFRKSAMALGASGCRRRAISAFGRAAGKGHV